ncbi:IclR family transcriptional regulator domain-containing protein [Pseudorhodoplanes sinuspersici]|uniref:IclR family transcriptional regulator n=1 Tax=Pseudorhodoplanes sinuspersici TaxID=1235591 RepID=A0A1W6ZPF4_9HYPH|nr:IclR family transcriptional regulator C-terminal domain-containing protein [Pseudorhodoplanes sinuspersici]ARP99251.1 IclR family transcriptional regulator [Pseudorhodoplanes sinuspersici]RKE69074.1 IclR family transcriptional regulator [Pseudorhodoplanes sinuspersici]
MPRISRSEAEQNQADRAGPEFLEALARGLRVIQSFDRDRRQLSLSDVAKQVDLPRASVRRTLHTLVQLGFAETDGKLFRLTPRVLTLAGAYLLSNPIASILQPAIDRLSAEINASCSTAVLDGDDVVMIVHASPSRILPLSAQVGFRIPAFASSLGRVLLADLDDAGLDAFLARIQPHKLTEQTIVDKKQLWQAILKARADGYSLADQEVEVGFRSISVALKRLDGRTIAALNIGIHTERGTPEMMRQTFLPKLRSLASELQQQLI